VWNGGFLSKDDAQHVILFVVSWQRARGTVPGMPLTVSGNILFGH
jgi:hypothetical protein